jgi:DNA-binding MarR family transcriptional regulator
MSAKVADQIDEMNAAWARELPDLDPSALGVVGRVIVIAQHLEKSVNAALTPFGLSLGQFDILATLRRQGAAGRMTPTQLMKSVMLSSGGMTNRLDRLEAAGWIRREADPDDRRGVVVGLTPSGRALIDEAASARFEEARASLPDLGKAEMKQLEGLLRRWLLELTAEEKTTDGYG